MIGERFNAWLDRSDAALDRRIQTLKYTLALEAALVADGMDPHPASKSVRAEREADPEEFLGRATDFFAYRRRITTGEEAIPTEVFQFSLNANPRAVLDAAARWADVRNAQEAAFADWAHTAPLVP